jgi:hypothetical protein
MHRRTWKKAEMRAARILGGRRVALSGAMAPENGLPKSDMMGGLLDHLFPVNEVKHRSTWEIQAWVRQLRRRAHPHGHWLLVVGSPEMHDQFAVLPLRRLAELIEAASAGQADAQGAPNVGGAGESAPPR